MCSLYSTNAKQRALHPLPRQCTLHPVSKANPGKHSGTGTGEAGTIYKPKPRFPLVLCISMYTHMLYKSGNTTCGLYFPLSVAIEWEYFHMPFTHPSLTSQLCTATHWEIHLFPQRFEMPAFSCIKCHLMGFISMCSGSQGLPIYTRVWKSFDIYSF